MPETHSDEVDDNLHIYMLKGQAISYDMVLKINFLPQVVIY